VLAVYGQNTYNGAHPSLWYFFVFDSSNPPKCQLWSAPSGTQFPSLGPAGPSVPSNKSAIDTYSWYNSLSGLALVTQQTTIQYNTSPITSSAIPVTFDDSSNPTYLDSASLHNLVQAFADMNQIPGSWNEIGKYT
jgi:hypothetical protein